VVSDEEYLNKEFVTRIQKRGAEVLAARNNSSVMSAANAIKDHLHDWMHGTKHHEWVSMGIINEEGHYGLPKDICFSLPVRCKNFDYEIVTGLKIDEFSQSKINITLEELTQEKEEAFST
jgi:malate/lactate dehydrogenase